MLIIEIAVGVFLGGMGLWMFVSYREKKKQAEHDREQEKLAFNAAERYVTERFTTLSVERVNDFRERLATIFDDSSRSAMEAASSEWELSREHIENATRQVAIEAREALKEYFSAADKTGTREQLNQHIEYLISDSIRSVNNELMLMYVNELQSFNDDDLPSVTKGHPRKLFNLGNAHRLGENVEQDYKKAERLLCLSASQGYTDAQALLGSMYYSGEGVAQDYQEALKWLRLAADKEDAFAQNGLGLMYSSGYGVPQNHGEALRWLHLSAEQGLAAAQSNIGAMYCEGEGIEQDYVQAAMWFMTAAAKGESNANNNLKVAYKSMTPEQISEAERLALIKDKSVLGVLLRLSESSLPSPPETFLHPALLAAYFSENYLAILVKNYLWLALPMPEEIERWSISELELARCTEECVLLATMGVFVTVKKNKGTDYYSTFSSELANRVSTLLSWQDRDGAPDEIKGIIENYIDALQNERMVGFACDYTERVFGGNANESSIFAANFWDRAFAVGMATMGASKEFFEWCMIIEMKNEIMQHGSLEPNVQLG